MQGKCVSDRGPGAVVGGVGGAITADSAEKANERESRIKETLAGLHMQDKYASISSLIWPTGKLFPCRHSRMPDLLRMT